MSAALPRPSGSAEAASRATDGDLALGAKEFGRIAALIHTEAGIYLPEGKSALVFGRLVKRLRALGLRSFRDYCALVESNQGLDERQRMIAALTTNVTSFFREAHHFEHLRRSVLPRLIDRARGGGRVRLWSAGCSRGHEPYSLAMTVLAMMPEAADRDVRILATDIDPDVIGEGRAGVYDRAELESVPRADLLRFFHSENGRQDGSRLSVAPDLRRLVAFRELNLVGSWPMSGKFDVIFCRNVAIYFDEATQSRLWARFADQSVPGGTLCIGHSERLTGPAARRYANVGVTTFHLGEGRDA